MQSQSTNFKSCYIVIRYSNTSFVLQAKQSINPEAMVVPASVTDTPFNIKFPLNKRPEETLSKPLVANEEPLPKALTTAPLPSKQLPPLTHQRTIPDLFQKDKIFDNKNIKSEDEGVRYLAPRLFKSFHAQLS